MIKVKEALDTVLQHTQRQPVVQTEFQQSLGMVLAEDIQADADMPPFHRSMMDGYAVRAVDTMAAPVTLEVVGYITAGGFPKFTIQEGQAARIMTGAPLPGGADAVREVEKTRSLDGGMRVEILEAVEPWQNVVQKGAEVAMGETILAAGTYIHPAVVGVLAAVGKTEVKVYRKPRVAILATGDELVDPHIRPARGQIRNTNSFTLAALCRNLGLEPVLLGVAKDDRTAIKSRLVQGLDADVLLVTGGVSMGDLDLVGECLIELGVRIHFDKVAIKPGKPTVFGKLGEKTIFALPGNPVSSATVFDVLVRPALRKMMGFPVYQNVQVQAVLTSFFTNRSNRENYHPSVTWYEDGTFYCRPLQTRGSGDLVSYARSNAYLICPQEVTTIDADSLVQVMLREDFYLT